MMLVYIRKKNLNSSTSASGENILSLFAVYFGHKSQYRIQIPTPKLFKLHTTFNYVRSVLNYQWFLITRHLTSLPRASVDINRGDVCISKSCHNYYFDDIQGFIIQ